MRDQATQLAAPLIVIATAGIVGVAALFVFVSVFGTVPPGTGVASPSRAASGSAPPAPTTVAATATARPIENPSPALSPTSDATSPPPQPTPIVHVVAPGEHLIRIAERYGVTVEDLVELNEIEDRDRILVGQRLLISVPDE